MKALGVALEDGSAEDVERQLNDILRKTISILDTKARESQKENFPGVKATTKTSVERKPSVCFYHGFLLGLLQSKPEWVVRSNPEAGEGFSDIIIEPEDIDSGIVIEVKYSPSFAGLDAACEAAMKQIMDRRYYEYLKNDGRENITAYGIAFFKKRCRVVVRRL